MTDEIRFDRSDEEDALMMDIVSRATDMAQEMGDELDELTLLMDICATHANGTPLRLADLLEADNFNFAHDVFGIHRHINRETGKLENFFLPRYAA